MPIDECGNRAHAAVFHKACVSRLNAGQFKEHYIAACCRDLAKWVRAVSSTASEDEIWGRLLRFYEIISPRDYSILKTYDAADRKMHIECVISSGIHPTIAAVDTHLDDMPLDELDKVIIPGGGEVTYIDHRGKTIHVRSRPLIGPKYMYILEKTYDRPMAMSFGTVQHHGLPAGNSRESRNSHPGKQISPRFFAEAENRLYCSMFGSRVVAEALDLANNPDTHRTAIRSILTAENPACIEDIAQRHKNPIGGSRALQLTNHLNACVGPMIVTEEKPKLGE